MENINFEISEKDIAEYLEKHRLDEDIKYKEAMFVKYMKECRVITKESMRIIVQKYNNIVLDVDGLSYMWNAETLFQPLPEFSDYLKNINNLDISGMCHILIPTMKYYGQDNMGRIARYLDLQDVFGLSVSENSLLDEIVLATDDYSIANQITKIPDENGVCINKIVLSREDSIRQLIEYESIYGKEAVNQISQYVKERV